MATTDECKVCGKHRNVHIGAAKGCPYGMGTVFKPATQPAPQAGSSGEGLKVGDEVTPVQAEPVATKPTSLPNWPPGAVADITAALDAEFEQKVEAKEPWKPVVGEKVLVEAVVKSVYESGIYIWVVEDRGGARDVVVHLSQLRPLPVVQGGD